MKCVNCKHSLKKDSPICPNCHFDMTVYLQEAAETRARTLGKRILLSLLTVVLLVSGCLAALFFGGVFTPAQVTVLAALSATAKELSQEQTALTQSLPLLTHLMRVANEQSTLSLSTDDDALPLTTQMTLDMEHTQFSATGNLGGSAPFTAYLSPQAAILQLDEVDWVLGIDLQTLVSDLSASLFASAFDMEAISAGYRTDILEQMNQMDEELNSLLSAATLELATDLDATRLDDEVLELNGETIETKAYALSLSPATVEQVATTFLHDFCHSPVFSPYLALVAHQSHMSLDQLHDTLAQSMDVFLQNLLQLEDCTFTVNLYEGRVVLLSALRQESSYAIALNPTGDILAYLALVRRDASGISPYATASLTLDNGALTAILDVLGQENALHYFTRDTSNNLILSRDNVPSHIISVDTSIPDTLSLSIPLQEESIFLSSSLTQLEENWFAPPDYTDLLTMSQTDLLLLAMALPF